MDEVLLALPFYSMANSTAHAPRHPLSRAPLPLRPAYGGLAAPPFQSGVGFFVRATNAASVDLLAVLLASSPKII